jgi:hypothetical protein
MRKGWVCFHSFPWSCHTSVKMSFPVIPKILFLFRCWNPGVLSSENNKIHQTRLVLFMFSVHWQAAYIRANLCPCLLYISMHVQTYKTCRSTVLFGNYWKSSQTFLLIHVVPLKKRTWMNECIRGRPRPALAPQLLMISCASPSILALQQSYTSNEVQYLTYKGALVDTWLHEIMAQVGKS